MKWPVGSRDNVLKSIHHLECARGLSADDIVDHINTNFLAPVEDFEPHTSNPFREDVSVCSSRTVNDDFLTVTELSILKKLCSINPAKGTGTGQYPRMALKGERGPFGPTHHGYHE